MPLPENGVKVAWPPEHLKGELDDIREAAAWYSADMGELRSMSGSTQIPQAKHEPRDQGQDSRVGNRGRFWSRRGTDTAPNRQQYHVPVASDLAAVSADLVFGDPPTLRVADDRNDPTQQRLDDIWEEAGVANTLLEGAEIAAALGGAFLRADWDEDVATPMLTVVHPDSAAPEWRWGRLTAVTFWSQIATDGKTVWRHLERHEGGAIEHGLYAGSSDELGKRYALETMPETADLEDVAPLPTGVDLGAAYVPNVLPNRRRRRSHYGRPDVQGAFDVLDALDETYTSWMRDVRLGQARIIADQAALTKGEGRGGGLQFDPDREVYAGLDIDPTSSSSSMIEPVQFAIRTEQHERTAMGMVERIASAAGYSPQTLGLHIEGRADSGTALRLREARTVRTRDRKQRYWSQPLGSMIFALLAVDREILGNSDVQPQRPSIDWGDSLASDPRETAETLRMLKEAKATSVETRVQMASPHLEGKELAAEVERVKDQEGIGALADPAGGPV